MKKAKFSRDWLILAILTVLTVFTWIGFDVYWALTRPTPPKVPADQLLPLDPKLEIKVLENLSQKEIIGKEELVLPPESKKQ